jgi:ABC-2 type transport system ATP-binding protein
MTTVISTRGLQKHFGRTVALDGLDFSVDAGEIHGFLGPNGAGKTTTIRILLGLARATGGEATLFGREPWREAAELHKRVAYIPGDVSIWPNFTGGESIDLLTKLRGGMTVKTAYRERKQRLLETFQLDPRKKVVLVAAFATTAELYVLDEPTSGLDPLMEQVFNREIDRVAREGATVLLSSHILSEVEALCDRVTIIRAGKTVESGTLAELRHLSRTEIAFVHDSAKEAAVTALPDIHDLVIDEGRVRFTVDSDRVSEFLPDLGRLGVQGLTVAPPSLEDLFLRHYGDEVAPVEEEARV